MQDLSHEEQLIEKLAANPEQADKDGSTYNLLQAYFKGFPTETLGPLITHANPLVRNSALWIASELGKSAMPLVPDVVAVLSELEEPSARYYALDVLMICSYGEYAREFLHIVHALEDVNQVIRVRAMFLLSNAGEERLMSGIEFVDTHTDRGEVHKQGLTALHRNGSLDVSEVASLIENESPLLRKYGAILAKRRFDQAPELLARAALQEDPDIRKFAQRVIDDSQPLDVWLEKMKSSGKLSGPEYQRLLEELELIKKIEEHLKRRKEKS